MRWRTHISRTRRSLPFMLAWQSYRYYWSQLDESTRDFYPCGDDLPKGQSMHANNMNAGARGEADGLEAGREDGREFN